MLTVSGLFPAILNLASNAVVDSNATCGHPGPEVYCKLVEHVPGRPAKNPHCARCDANSVLFRGGGVSVGAEPPQVGTVVPTGVFASRTPSHQQRHRWDQPLVAESQHQERTPVPLGHRHAGPQTGDTHGKQSVATVTACFWEAEGGAQNL